MNTMKTLSKRSLSLLLTLLMCLGMVQITAFAEEETHPHVNNCQLCAEGTHDGWPCDCCGAGYDDKGKNPAPEPEPEEPKHEHTYMNGWCAECGEPDPNHVHWYDETGKCVCGDEHKTHTVTSWIPDYSNLDMHVGTCSVCGQKIEEEHTFGSVQWGKKECTKCIYYVEVTNEPTHTHNYTYTYDSSNKHIGTCTSEEGTCTAKTVIQDCVFDQKGEDPTRDYCICGNSKSKIVDVGPGDEGGCKNGNHTYGNVAVPTGDYHHTVTCLECGDQKVVSCDLEKVLDDSHQPVAWVCRICGQWKPIEGDNYCTDGSHEYEVAKEVLSEDGKSVFTTWTCEKCGYTMVQSICNSPSHVTVKYVYEGGTTASSTVSKPVIKGTEYEIKSPDIKGYEPDQAVISGTSDGKDADYKVVYKKVETKYTLTINYVYDDTDGVFATYTGQFAEGEKYEVKSKPAPEGYEFAAEGIDEVKSGVMPGRDETIKVSYKPVTYTQTIVYVIDGADEPFDTKTRDFTINTIKALESVVSPAKEGYTVDVTSVPAPDKLENTIVKVTYKPSTIYKLVVNHEYVAHDGTRTTETETLGETYKIGDSYTTAAKNREGYTLSVTPEAANGSFEAKDVTLTYEYTENTFTVTWLPGYGDNSAIATETYGKVTQTEDYRSDNPADPARSGYTFTSWGDPVTGEDGNITITAQWRYNGGGGGGSYTPDPDPDPDPDPVVDVDEPDVPLVDVPDVDVPQTETPEELVEVPEEDVPLADVPKTGDNTGLWRMAALMSAAGLAVLTALERRQRREE